MGYCLGESLEPRGFCDIFVVDGIKAADVEPVVAVDTKGEVFCTLPKDEDVCGWRSLADVEGSNEDVVL